MDSFKVCQFIVVRIDAETEEESGVAPIDDLVVAELVSVDQMSAFK